MIHCKGYTPSCVFRRGSKMERRKPDARCLNIFICPLFPKQKPLAITAILGLLSVGMASNLHSTRYHSTCDSETNVPRRTTSWYVSLAGRSRLECLARCSTDQRCVLADFNEEAKRCYMYQDTETNCSTAMVLTPAESPMSFVQVRLK